MKKMTKWLAVCAVCVMGSVPAWQQKYRMLL